MNIQKIVDRQITVDIDILNESETDESIRQDNLTFYNIMRSINNDNNEYNEMIKGAHQEAYIEYVKRAIDIFLEA